jgi:hypothetical protein
VTNWRGRATSIAGALAVVVVGCGPLPASNSPAPTPSAVPTLPPATVSPGLSGGVVAHAPYPVISIGGFAINAISLSPGSPQIHRLSGFGPRVAFDEVGYGGDLRQGQTIWLGDLETQTLTKVATSEGGDAAWMPVTRGDAVAWVEWHYADNTALTGALTWRIRLKDLGTKVTTTVRSGISPVVDGPGGIPLLALTDQTLILAAPSPSPTNRQRWEIDVLARPSGNLIRAIESDEWVYSVAGSDKAVAFTVGKRDAKANFVYDTRLMIALASDKTAHELAHDSFEVAVDANRVVWVDDRAASQAPSPAAVAPRIFQATGPDFVPGPISPPPNGDPIVGSAWPAAGDGFVTWTDNQDSPPKHPDPNGDHLVLWSAARGPVQLEPTAGMLLSSVGNGWLVWYNDWQPTLYLYGIRLKDVPPPH